MSSDTVEPCLGTGIVVLRQVPKLRQGLETLEDQFDLPAKAVPLQNISGGEGCFGEGTEQDDVLGIGERFRLDGRALATGMRSDFALCQPDRFGTFPDDADPPPNRRGRPASRAHRP